MKAYFDEQEIPEVKSVRTGEITPAKKVLFFHLERQSLGGPNAAPYTFDGPATEEHKAQYASQLAAFLKSKEPAHAAVKHDAKKHEK